MAGAKIPTRAKKRASRSASRPTSSSIRFVRSSSAPTASELAARLGISASTLRRRALRGEIAATVDARGRYHFPSRATGTARVGKRRARQQKSKVIRKKRRIASTTSVRPEPRKKRKIVKKRGKAPSKAIPRKKKAVPRISPPSGRDERKKRPSRPTGKKLVRRKKKKRVRKTRPRRERFQQAIIADTRPAETVGPAPFGVTTSPSPIAREPTLEFPMPIDQAMTRVGHAMRDFVLARPKWERLATGRVFHDLKVSFRQTYGQDAWVNAYDWIVDEWGLEPYIFDYEGLRDT